MNLQLVLVGFPSLFFTSFLLNLYFHLLYFECFVFVKLRIYKYKMYRELMKSIVSTVLDTIFKSKNWHFSFQKSLEVTVVFYRELMEVNCLYGFRVSSFKFWENRFEKFKIILKSFVNLIQSNVYFFLLK